jgi:hypothetical protein
MKFDAALNFNEELLGYSKISISFCCKNVILPFELFVHIKRFFTVTSRFKVTSNLKKLHFSRFS